jgi:hypothetical protein
VDLYLYQNKYDQVPGREKDTEAHIIATDYRCADGKKIVELRGELYVIRKSSLPLSEYHNHLP